MEFKDFKHNFQVKSKGSNLIICGYASVFNIIDAASHIILPLSFQKSLKTREVKLLWQHKSDIPLGVINKIYEDNHGLYIEAEINSSTQYGSDAKSLVEQGAINGFSIGFYTKKSNYNKDGTMTISEIDLWEISLVTFPCNSKAVITEIIPENNKKNKQNIDNRGIDYMSDLQNAKISKLEKSLEKIELALSRNDFSIDNNDSTSDVKFVSFLKTGAMDMETKALSSSNDEAGYTIRSELETKIINSIYTRSPLRQLASIETISSNSLDILIEKTHFGAAWVGETTERDDTNNSKITQQKIYVHELYAQPKATQRLLDDNVINLESWIVDRLQESLSRLENDSFINGDGNNKPFGILSYEEDVIKSVKVSDSHKITIDDLYNLINSLDEYYLSNATFLMHRTTVAQIQKLKDENGRFLWQNSLVDKSPSTLLGIPVVICSEIPEFKEGNKSIILGDFKSGYKIVDKVGIHTIRDHYTEKPFVKFYTVKRVGGAVVDPQAIATLTI
jgi:HK97 family phage major capsid protein/HK97 family phage prohead protease